MGAPSFNPQTKLRLGSCLTVKAVRSIVGSLFLMLFYCSRFLPFIECGKPAVYTRVSHYRDWISSVVGAGGIADVAIAPVADVAIAPVAMAIGEGDDTSAPSVAPSIGDIQDVEVLSPSISPIGEPEVAQLMSSAPSPGGSKMMMMMMGGGMMMSKHKPLPSRARRGNVRGVTHEEFWA